MDMVFSTPRLLLNSGVYSAPHFATANPAAESAPCRFACPECQGAISRAADATDAIMQCPSCLAVIVPPHPEFGCRAMPYLDWLRFQEMSVEESIDELVDVADPTAPPPPNRLRAVMQRVNKPASWTGVILTTIALGWLAREQLEATTSLMPPPHELWEQSSSFDSSGASQTTPEAIADASLASSMPSSASSPGPATPYRGPDLPDAFRRSLQTDHAPSSLPE